ncbi:hypothetical protein GJB62_25090 [Nostoc sp. ATCC 53789]|nr:hypothetical protein GJB62_25090 [Nostoc sp. ATCC 53789]
MSQPGLVVSTKRSQRGLLPKGEASAKGVSPMSDWRWTGEPEGWLFFRRGLNPQLR